MALTHQFAACLGLVLIGFVGLWCTRIWLMVNRSWLRGWAVAIQSAASCAIIGGIILVCATLIPDRVPGAEIMIVATAFVILALAIVVVHRRRQLESRTLCTVLGYGVRKELPQDEVMDAFAAENRGEMGTRAAIAATELRRGRPLHEALKLARWNLPVDAALACQLQLPSDQLSEALLGTTRIGSAFQRESNIFFRRLIYLLILLGVTAVAARWIVFSLIPILNELPYDGNAIGSLDQGVIVDIANELTLPYFVLLAVGALPILTAAFLCGIYLLGWTRWEPPVLRRFTRPYHSAMILSALAPAANRSEDLVKVLGKLSETYPLRYVRRKLGKALRSAQRGGDVFDSLQDTRLMREDQCEILKSAQGVGNLPWALHEMAHAGVTHWWSTKMFVSNLTVGVLTILVTLPVLGFATWMFRLLRDAVLQLS